MRGHLTIFYFYFGMLSNYHLANLLAFKLWCPHQKSNSEL